MNENRIAKVVYIQGGKKLARYRKSEAAAQKIAESLKERGAQIIEILVQNFNGTWG